MVLFSIIGDEVTETHSNTINLPALCVIGYQTFTTKAMKYFLISLIDKNNRVINCSCN